MTKIRKPGINCEVARVPYIPYSKLERLFINAISIF